MSMIPFKVDSYIYGRCGSLSRNAVEIIIQKLEKADHAYIFASGLTSMLTLK